MDKYKNNICLIGMPGTFKTSAGKKVAQYADMLFLDTDEMIQFDNSMSISDIINECGEAYFRKLEGKLIRGLEEYNNTVFSTGGGAVLNKKNAETLKAISYVIWLTADSETIYKRLMESDTKRPLINPMTVENIESIQKERSKHYQSIADAVIDTSKISSEETAIKIVDEVLKLTKSEEK